MGNFGSKRETENRPSSSCMAPGHSVRAMPISHTTLTQLTLLWQRLCLFKPAQDSMKENWREAMSAEAVGLVRISVLWRGQNVTDPDCLWLDLAFPEEPFFVHLCIRTNIVWLTDRFWDLLAYQTNPKARNAIRLPRGPRDTLPHLALTPSLHQPPLYFKLVLIYDFLCPVKL